MKCWLTLPVLTVAALAFATIGVASPGQKRPKPSTKGGQFVFHVTRPDRVCGQRIWAIDTLKRVFKVRRNDDGSYTLRIEDTGRFVTLAGKSPSADSCPDVIRRGKHGRTLAAGIKGKLHGYLQGTVTGGTFDPKGTCTSTCTAGDFVAGFFSSGASYTCNLGYAGCRFSFDYTAQRRKPQHLRYHHWVDRGTNGVNEIFIGDIASA